MNEHVKAPPSASQRGLFSTDFDVPVLPLTRIAQVSWTSANFIINADSREALEKMPEQTFQTIVTSPPYFQQRNYSEPGQIGGENTTDLYVNSLRSVFKEAYRVLKDDGLLWLNIGDKYLDGRLLGMPWRVALALAADGWILRSDVIWQKPNAMPHSAKSRPTHDHEYLFMFSKSKDYFYDADAIREPHVTFSENSKMKGGRGHLGKRGGTPENGKNTGNQNLHDGRWDQAFHPLGRNKRTVWSVPLSKFRGAHFAVFPEKLIQPCILSSSKPGDIVLDMFFGSGTTGAVCISAGRKFVGVDLNRDYCSMASDRLSK